MKKGWQTKTIGDVCEFQRGLTYAKGDEVDVSDNVVLRATNIDLPTNFLIFDELKYINDKVFVPESKKVKKGSLMICMASGSKSHLGKVAFIDDDYGYAFGGFMGMLTPLNGLSPKYLFHLMTSEDYKDFIGALSDGANINNLTFDKLKVFPVPIPPLAEQQRIVGLLDEAFDGLATAKANAEKNLQNARAFFESHLQSVFTQRGPGWVDKPLGDICSFENGDRGTNYPSKSARTETGIPFINAGHLTDDGIDLETMDYIPRERFDLLSNGKIRKGDILFCLRGSLGKFASVGDLSEGAIASSLVIVRPNKTVLNDFLVAYFRSPLCAAMINRFKNGAAQPNLSAQSLRNFIAPVPPLAKQESVVEQITDLHEETQRLARLYERKHAALDALKMSLLHQAFTGAL
jgi:type I restriction enzyme S subunit